MAKKNYKYFFYVKKFKILEILLIFNKYPTNLFCNVLNLFNFFPNTQKFVNDFSRHLSQFYFADDEEMFHTKIMSSFSCLEEFLELI